MNLEHVTTQALQFILVVMCGIKKILSVILEQHIGERILRIFNANSQLGAFKLLNHFKTNAIKSLLVKAD